MLRRVFGDGPRIVGMEPSTRMRAEAYPGEDPSKLPTPEQVAEAFISLAMADFAETGQTIEL